MAPLELFCRGGDPRAMKGFIAASLSGADVAFTPMTAAVSGEARGAQIKLGELTDANAIARFNASWSTRRVVTREIDPSIKPRNPVPRARSNAR